MHWIYMSYPLSDHLSAYGNGPRIIVKKLSSIKDGSSNNSTLLSMPSHFGTHIDYPLHFSDDGLTGDDYQAKDFVFKNTIVADISGQKISDFLIKPQNLIQLEPDPNADFLLIKTGFGSSRTNERYWAMNWGFAPETAAHIKSLFPSLRCVGFDLISLSSYQQREIGRNAHRAFLIEHNLLVIEDMDLTGITENTRIYELYVAPLRFRNADGAPVTVLAKID